VPKPVSKVAALLIRRTLILLACTVLLIAASPAPEGSFTMSGGSGPYTNGGSVTFTVSPITHVNNSYEVTLAVGCQRPDGTEVPVGDQWMQHQGKSPFLAEWNTFGGFNGVQPVFQLTYGGDYTCLARLAAIKWVKGIPVQSWFLDQDTFVVVP